MFVTAYNIALKSKWIQHTRISFTENVSFPLIILSIQHYLKNNVKKYEMKTLKDEWTNKRHDQNASCNVTVLMSTDTCPQNTRWDGNSSPAGQENYRLLWNQRFSTVPKSDKRQTLSSAKLILSTQSDPIYFNIIFPLTSRSSKWSLHVRCSSQAIIYIIHCCHACCMLCPCYPIRFEHRNTTQRRAKLRSPLPPLLRFHCTHTNSNRGPCFKMFCPN
jgi:hypothetical protein